MNLGIIHNRRPEKTTADSAANKLFGDVRMREIAKQMGLDAKDFGKEAMNVWKMLDELAENDPKAYSSFINEQLKNGPPTQGNNNNNTSSDTSTPKYFNPLPGYVVKLTMASSIKLFVNLCAHEIVDIPKNPNSNRPVPKDTRAVPSTSSLQIPLIIGTLREIKDFSGAFCQAIDVVFHPWVLERMQWDAAFKREVMKLAIQWVQEDAKVMLASPVGKFIKSQYKGGVVMGDKILTAKSLINHDQQQTRQLPNETTSASEHDNQKNTARPSTMAMESPSDLLKQMSLDKEIGDFLIRPVGESATPSPCPSTTKNLDVKPSTAPKSKKPLIEEIKPTMIDNQTEGIESTKGKTKTAKKASGVVKRGFLNAKGNAPLYPKGSSEGKPASAYVNLLSRSKVVDMNEMEAQQKQQTLQQESERKAILSSLTGVSPVPTTAAPPASSAIATNNREEPEEDFGDFEFEQLCMAADPEFQSDLHRDNNSNANDPTNQLFGQQLNEFAQFLSSQS